MIAPPPYNPTPPKQKSKLQINKELKDRFPPSNSTRRNPY
jgi:hypothetical protein